jgi:hypothetical protein
MRLQFILAALLVTGCDDFRKAFPPADYYAPLVDLPVNVQEEGAYATELRHKYRGDYHVELRFERSPPLGTVPSALELDVSCGDNEHHSFDRHVTGSLSAFATSEGGGLFLVAYEVPQDVPLRRLVRCRIEVQKGDPALRRQFGQARLVFRNASTL